MNSFHLSPVPTYDKMSSTITFMLLLTIMSRSFHELAGRGCSYRVAATIAVIPCFFILTKQQYRELVEESGAAGGVVSEAAGDCGVLARDVLLVRATAKGVRPASLVVLLTKKA